MMRIETVVKLIYDTLLRGVPITDVNDTPPIMKLGHIVTSLSKNSEALSTGARFRLSRTHDGKGAVLTSQRR